MLQRHAIGVGLPRDLTAWSFLVVSSDKQAESLDAQAQWAQRVCDEHGWTITRTFRGVSSGLTGTRKLLQTLLSELEQTPKRDRPQRVLLIRLDRLGRGLAIDSVAALAQIHRLGVMLHTREDQDVKIEKASDAILPMLRSITAGLENEARVDKAKTAHANKRARGEHAGHAPYGTLLVNRKPVPYEPEAKIVRELFELRLQGWGYHRLARYAIAHAPAKRRAGGGTRQLRWDETTVARLLATRTHRGLTVPEEIFDAVQGRRNPRIDQQAKYPWPLRGAVRCTCGRMLSVTYSGPKRHRTRYYVCRYAAGHQRYPYHRADVLEAAFLERLRALASDPHILTEDRVDLDVLRAQKAQYEQERERLESRKRKTWELAEEGGITSADLRERLAALAVERTAVEGAIARVEQEIAGAVAVRQARVSTAEVVGAMWELWPQAPVEQQREIARAVAAYLGGLYAEPPQNAKATRLLDGSQFHG